MKRVLFLATAFAMTLYADSYAWPQAAKQSKGSSKISELDKKLLQSQKSGAKMFIVDARSGQIIESTGRVALPGKSSAAKDKVKYEIQEETLDIR